MHAQQKTAGMTTVHDIFHAMEFKKNEECSCTDHVYCLLNIKYIGTYCIRNTSAQEYNSVNP